MVGEMAKRVPAPPDETYEEVEAPRRSRSRKLKLVIDDDGAIDWSGVPSDRKVDVMAAIAADEDVSATLRATHDAPSDELITDEHLNNFLDFIEAAEQFLIPRLIARKSVGGLPAGQFQIHPSVAKKALVFQNRDKLVPTGVAAANANLPPKIKKLINKVGPGTQFVGRFFYELRAQQVRVLNMQVQWYQEHAKHTAGGRATSPAANQTQPPKPNGKPPEAETVAPVVLTDEPSQQIA